MATLLVQARAWCAANACVVSDRRWRKVVALLKVQAAGHRIGNHTFNHLNLWKTPLATYLDNTAECQAALTAVLGEEVTLFRPPYGKMTPRAGRRLRAQYEVVMWEVIAGDWNPKLSPERGLPTTTPKLEPPRL